MAQIRSGEQPAGTLERRGIRKDGTTFWAEVTLSLEAPGRESPGSFVGVLDDVTARHEADEKFRVIAERSLAGIVILQDERIAYANPAMGEIAGLSVDELTGMTTKDVRAMILEEDRPAREGGRGRGGGSGGRHDPPRRLSRGPPQRRRSPGGADGAPDPPPGTPGHARLRPRRHRAGAHRGGDPQGAAARVPGAPRRGHRPRLQQPAHRRVRAGGGGARAARPRSRRRRGSSTWPSPR